MMYMPNEYQCWMTIDHNPMRLWTHYFWIFAAQFFTILLYGLMFIHLRRRIKESAILGSRHTESLRRMNRVVAYMVVYPIVYTVCSLPLAAGRMASANGHTPSILYFCVAGSMMTLSGVCDTLLYTFTRKSMVLDTPPKSQHDHSYHKFSSGERRQRSMTHNLYSLTVDDKGPTTSVSAVKADDSSRVYRSDSTDAIIPRSDVELAPMGTVYQETTIEVTHEPAYPQEQSQPQPDRNRFIRPGNQHRW